MGAEAHPQLDIDPEALPGFLNLFRKTHHLHLINLNPNPIFRNDISPLPQ